MHGDFELLKQGAEAKIYTGKYLGVPTIIKERFIKGYRHPDLDKKITKDRIRNEARALARCKTIGVKTPCLYLIDMERRRIYMEFYDQSITVKDFLINVVKKHENDEKVNTKEVLEKVTLKVGLMVRRLHKYNIVHGDLTTSNMLLVPKNQDSPTDHLDWLDIENIDIALIDFGLSYVESKAEDKGVDLYVLERALLSTHNDFPNLFNQILEGYKTCVSSNKTETSEILSKLDEVRARGRKRTMVG